MLDAAEIVRDGCYRSLLIQRGESGIFCSQRPHCLESDPEAASFIRKYLLLADIALTTRPGLHPIKRSRISDADQLPPPAKRAA